MDEIHFDIIWKDFSPELLEGITAFWKENVPEMTQQIIDERLRQCVIAVRNQSNTVIAISTAFHIFVDRLHHHFYATRLLVDQQHRIPGLPSTLLVRTRDFLESIHETDGPEDERCIGIITLVENEKLRQFRNEAVWPASGMVYIGDSPKGHPIRVYYFKGAKI